jgi:aspartate 1-decarboxylase
MNMVTLLKSKLHQARVTDANKEYEGSIGISRELCEAVGFLPWEKVLVANIETGSRLETYIIILESPGKVVLNGAAAHAFLPGERCIIMSFVSMDETAAQQHSPRVAVLDGRNRIAELRLPKAPPGMQ